MKVVCDRAGLVESLNLAQGAVVARTPKEVLRCVKLTAENGTLTVSATDLEVALRLSSPRVEVEEPGEALVPADKLNQIVRESTDTTLELETEQDLVHIRGQDAHFQVFGKPVGDFPPIPEFDGAADFEINAAELRRLLSLTVFATAKENSRYAINGVLMERDGDKVTLVATDGRRLAMAKCKCDTAKTDKSSAIVPTKALNMLQRLFDHCEEPARVRIADQQVLFATEDALLASRLVEGNFPPYQDVIPRDGDKKAELDTEVLASAVRRAALLTNEESRGVRFAFKEGELTLSSRAPEMGEAEVTVPLPSYSGEAFEIGFNPQFVLDALKVVKTDKVQGEFKSANKPGVIRTGPEFLYVVMPVNLQ